MKKSLSSLLVVLTLITFSPKASAVGGLIVGQYFMAAVAGVSMGASIPLFKMANKLGDENRRKRSTKKKIAGLVLGIIGTVMFVGGGYALDQENNDFEFLPIEKGQLSIAEQIYNNEIDELNAVKDMVAKDLSETEFKSLEEINEFAEQKWKEYGETLSPETLAVRAQIVNKMAL